MIDFIEGVRGTWSVRSLSANGKHQFRLSVVWRKDLAQALKAGEGFPKSTSGHVLLPVQKGGDDDPNFTPFDVRTNGVATFKQARGEPEIRVSYVNGDLEKGEIDIDFDPPDLWRRCHWRPSNSDPGSRAQAHSHLDDFHVAVFPEGLAGIGAGGEGDLLVSLLDDNGYTFVLLLRARLEPCVTSLSPEDG